MATTVDTSPGAKAVLDNFLSQYGLQGLGDWAWNKALNGESIDQIKLEMRDTPEFQARFPAMQEMAKQGRAMSVDQYMSMEDSYRSVLHSYGLPTGFYDQPQDFAKFMLGDVSPTELNDRVKQYTDAVMGDQETLTQMQRLYGDVGHGNNPTGDLLAHYLDPNVAAPLLTQQLAASQFASAASRGGFGQLSKAEAEQYGAQAGTTMQQAEQGFGQLYAGRELMQGLPGENQDQITHEQQLGALFGGNAADQEKIQNRARLRVAEGSGGGGFTATQKGISGLSSNEV